MPYFQPYVPPPPPPPTPPLLSGTVQAVAKSQGVTYTNGSYWREVHIGADAAGDFLSDVYIGGVFRSHLRPFFDGSMSYGCISFVVAPGQTYSLVPMFAVAVVNTFWGESD